MLDENNNRPVEQINLQRIEIDGSAFSIMSMVDPPSESGNTLRSTNTGDLSALV